MSFVALFDRIISAAAQDATVVEAARVADEAAARPFPWPLPGRGAPAPSREVAAMYDPDEAMAREADQQRLVEGLARELNGHFGSGRDVGVRLRTLQALLAMAHGLDPEPSAGLEFLRRQVVAPVERFARSAAEARALTVRVAAKVFGGLTTDAEGGLLRQSLGFR